MTSARSVVGWLDRGELEKLAASFGQPIASGDRRREDDRDGYRSRGHDDDDDDRRGSPYQNERGQNERGQNKRGMGRFLDFFD